MNWIETFSYGINTFFSGDTVLCALDMGVWWPGYVLASSAGDQISVAFWNENAM